MVLWNWESGNRQMQKIRYSCNYTIEKQGLHSISVLSKTSTEICQLISRAPKSIGSIVLALAKRVRSSTLSKGLLMIRCKKTNLLYYYYLLLLLSLLFLSFSLLRTPLGVNRSRIFLRRGCIS